MKPAPFVYHRPRDLGDAVRILGEVADEDGHVLAGGQSLAAMMAFRIARPAHLVDINAIAVLDRIDVQGGSVRIGACVRHAAFETPIEPGVTGHLLTNVVRHIAHGPIRARGTYCGSLAHADPASEWCLTLATLDGSVLVQNRERTRRIPAANLFEGMMSTTIEPGELLVEARLPLLPDGTLFGFVEFSRRAGDFAIAAVLATFRVVDGRIVEPRLGLGGAEAAPRRIEAAEAELLGALPVPQVFEAAAEAAAQAIQPLEDIDNDADYRRGLVRSLVRRSLDQALSR